MCAKFHAKIIIFPGIMVGPYCPPCCNSFFAKILRMFYSKHCAYSTPYSGRL